MNSPPCPRILPAGSADKATHRITKRVRLHAADKLGHLRIKLFRHCPLVRHGDEPLGRSSHSWLDELRRDPPRRIPGVAIVLGRMTKGVPLALSHNVKCNRVLHERVVLVAVATTEAPRAPDDERVVVT